MCWEDKRDPSIVSQMQEKDRQIQILQESNEKLKRELEVIYYELGMWEGVEEDEL
jgi:hypothetical protein